MSKAQNQVGRATDLNEEIFISDYQIIKHTDKIKIFNSNDR